MHPKIVLAVKLLSDKNFKSQENWGLCYNFFWENFVTKIHLHFEIGINLRIFVHIWREETLQDKLNYNNHWIADFIVTEQTLLFSGNAA
jgi:hypothetical protein